MTVYYTRWCSLLLLSLLFLGLPMTYSHAQVSVNLALDDPVYTLLEKLVHSHLTFTNALTIKPITRLYAARLVAEAIEQRQQALDAGQRPHPFLDTVLEDLASRFKPELQQIGFLYRPTRAKPFVFAPMTELKLDTVFAKDPLLHRASSGPPSTLQGVFGLQEGFVPGDNFTIRARPVSWATLWDHFAAYLEPQVIVHSHPLLDDNHLEAGLQKGYAKVSYANIELAVGRDTLWWGPASQGDLVLSNNAPPFNLVKLSTPEPFRFPGVYSELGEWQLTYVVARLEADRDFPHTLLSGLRVAFQPVSWLKLGYTNSFQAFGQGGVTLSAQDYLRHLVLPTFETGARTVNGVVAYDAVLSLPFVRAVPFLEGFKLYWQRGQDQVRMVRGWLGGANIIGGVIEGGRWDMRLEFAETHDAGLPWYTHPTYTSGFTSRQFFLGHPIGGDARSFFGRATYYFTPTAWIAADGRQEEYGAPPPNLETNQRRLGLEAAYQFPWHHRLLGLWGRLEYTTLAEQAGNSHDFNAQLSLRWHY